MPDRRTRAKLVRLTPAEFAEIERRAQAAGMLPSRYIRLTALTGSAPTYALGAPSPELIHTLGAIGAQLKTLAASAAEGTASRIDDALAELVTTLRQLTRPERS